ncbi:MAG TPA: cytochrome c [Woeseiaceae bacterium]|nr:cytochrome c [Woeseiaceae bacterium]
MHLRQFFAISLLLATSGVAAAEPRTIKDGVYTDRQAKAGERLYEQHCLTCHDKKYFRPVLKVWDGQPLGMLYTIMSASMPESNPGALPRKDYVDILAYILSLNRYPSGEAELDYVDGVLDDITITGRSSN